MDSATRKELRAAYKEQAMVGGVYCIQCSGNQRQWIKSTKNLAGQQNKFTFAMDIHSCPEPGMLAEWNRYGAQSFSFTVLEQLVKKETQTEQEFAEDIDVLLALWMEKQQQDLAE